MRIQSQFFSFLVCTLFFGVPALAADSDKTLADRIFGNADKNKNDSLDEKEVLEAKRIFKAAIFEKKKADELPGGKQTFDRIADAATKGKLGEGNVTKEEWQTYVKAGFDKKQAILKDAKEKAAAAAAAAKKKNEDQAKFERLRREKEQLEKKRRQDKKGKK